MEPNLEKETPPQHIGKAEGLGDSLPSFQSCMPHHIDGMAGEQQMEQHKAPPTECSGGGQPLCAYLAWANDHHHIAHMPATGKLQGVEGVQTPMVECQKLDMVSSMAPESRKQTSEQTPNI